MVRQRSAKSLYASSILAQASENFAKQNSKIARVVELVYTHDLKSCLARDVGSIPTSGTFKKTLKSVFLNVPERKCRKHFRVWIEA